MCPAGHIADGSGGEVVEDGDRRHFGRLIQEEIWPGCRCRPSAASTPPDAAGLEDDNGSEDP